MISICFPWGTVQNHDAEYLGVVDASCPYWKFPSMRWSPMIRSKQIGSKGFVSPLAVIGDRETGEVLYDPYDNLDNFGAATRKVLEDISGRWPLAAYRALKWRWN